MTDFLNYEQTLEHFVLNLNLAIDFYDWLRMIITSFHVTQNKMNENSSSQLNSS